MNQARALRTISRPALSLLCVATFLVAWLPSRSARAQCESLSAGTNVDASKRSGNETEGAIAIDPTNPNRMFYLSNVDFGSTLGAGYSSNGGASWTSTSSLTSACCDGSASWDEFGNLFACYIDSFLSNAVVKISTNGGHSFGNAGSISVFDQPTLTTGAGSVWVCYVSFNGIEARGATVSGLGSVGSFSSGQVAPGGGNGNFGDICIGPNGEVMVAYQDNTGSQGPATIYVNTDPDGIGGSGFGPRVTVTSTNVGGFDYIPAQNNRSVDAEVGLAWDRSGGPFDGRVYMVYTDETVNENDDMEIMVRHSDNDGATWSSAIRVNDDTPGNGKSQFLPRIALDQTTGNVAVSWYDCRNSPSNTTAQFFGTVSTDGGATFLPNVQISSGTSNSNTANSGIDYGDYTGLAFEAGKFFPLWADNSGSPSGNPSLPDLDMVTAGVTVTSGSVSEPTNPLASPATICPGDSSTLSADVGAGETVDWYTGSCGGTLVPGGASPSVSPASTTTYYARARDTSSGCESDNCASVTVTVGDDMPPTINDCPGDIVANSNMADCAAVVAWTEPTADDNCPGVTIMQTAGPAPGSTFAAGSETTITYTATDATNLTDTCSFTVTVTPSPDVNDDGMVSLDDVAPFIDVLLGNDTTPLHVYRADANCDGIANGDDIQAFVDALTM